MSKKKSFKIALAQLNVHVGAIEKNVDAILEVTELAKQQGASLLIASELCLTGYPPEDLLLRAGFVERVSQELQRLIDSSNKGVDLIIGYPQEHNGQLFNTAGVIVDGKLIAEYQKYELPNYSVFDEKRYFTAGSKPLVVDYKDHRLGISICEDIWHNQAIEQSVDAGASIIINLNASPYHTNKVTERYAIVRDKAAKVKKTIIYVNQVGGQDELVFDGASFVVNPQGDVLQQSTCFEEDVAIIECYKDEQGHSIVKPSIVVDLPSSFQIHSRKSHSRKSQKLEENEAMIYQALVCGLRDYVNKNGFKGIVMGLSGGIDSALTLAIATDALGADRVVAMMMPFKYTSDLSKTSAQAQANRLGVHYESISIEPMYNAFVLQLATVFEGLEKNTTEENIQARCRGLLLMAYSNKMGHMVLTTGNKSEIAVGYATLYGDMVGGYSVIKDVYKTLVYDLSCYRNCLANEQGESEVIPSAVINRPPSAELAPDQQDSDSLPPYDVLDGILELYIEQELAPPEIVAHGYSKEDVNRVTWMVRRNEYKRRQAAPGVRILKKAFGRDRRYPITSGYDYKA